MLFARSIRENLLVGKPEATDAEITAALERAQAADVMARQVDGVDTMVGERGRTLSGGERQRISIARALLKDPPILILDEATSALDAATEAKLQKALDEVMKGRTTFVIAHRLATIRNATRILVFEQGQVVEMGSFDELVAKGGRFAALARAQYLATDNTPQAGKPDKPARKGGTAKAPAAKNTPRKPGTSRSPPSAGWRRSSARGGLDRRSRRGPHVGGNRRVPPASARRLHPLREAAELAPLPVPRGLDGPSARLRLALAREAAARSTTRTPASISRGPRGLASPRQKLRREGRRVAASTAAMSSTSPATRIHRPAGLSGESVTSPVPISRRPKRRTQPVPLRRPSMPVTRRGAAISSAPDLWRTSRAPWRAGRRRRASLRPCG